ncbi:hypothetical protein CSH63_22075 [Micromonospora tulbaghiae]|uniref:Uncharacterized protein n=1 Tax=Micromonospora tulbaghiae TaxID=479978 RepID=A0A386WNV0_9ACTN|nr:hypothetical protein CSH63_22075 [Micromonospora tulbaghiae]
MAVDELIVVKRPRGYGNTAVQLVVDLHDLGERGGESGDAGWPRCRRCTRKPSPLGRLHIAGLDT